MFSLGATEINYWPDINTTAKVALHSDYVQCAKPY